MSSIREDADYIIKKSIDAVLPDEAVKRALENKNFVVPCGATAIWEE